MSGSVFRPTLLASPLIAAAALLGCSTIDSKQSPVVPYSEGLASYFEAKAEFASMIQSQLGSEASLDDYRIISINGPAYPIGTLISRANVFDVESRACVLKEAELPPSDPWSSLPALRAKNTVSLDAGVPPYFSEALSEAESLVGFKFERSRVANFEILEVRQQLLSRAEAQSVLRSQKCSQTVSSLTSDAVLVRGIVYGREVLVSSGAVSTAGDFSRLVGPGGELRLSYVSSGQFTIEESAPTPKFAILTAVRVEKTMGGPGAPAVITFGVPSDDELSALGIVKNPIEGLIRP